MAALAPSASARARVAARYRRALSIAMAARRARSSASCTSSAPYPPSSLLTKVMAPCTCPRAIIGTTTSEPIPSARRKPCISSLRAKRRIISSLTCSTTCVRRVVTATGTPTGSPTSGGHPAVSRRATACRFGSGWTTATRRMLPSSSTTSTMHHDPRCGSASDATAVRVAS